MGTSLDQKKIESIMKMAFLEDKETMDAFLPWSYKLSEQIFSTFGSDLISIERISS